MPILSQQRIEAETRSKWGGYTNRLMQGLLRQSLADFETFIEGVFRLFPEMQPHMAVTQKEFTPEPHKCNHDYTDRDKAFSPQQITGLERSFRNRFGDSKAADLLNLADRWVLAMFTTEQVGANGYWGTAYMSLVNHQLRETYNQSRTAWDALSRKRRDQISPPIPIVIDEGADYIEKIYSEGYSRVTAKVTKLHLPQIQRILVDGMESGKSWQEIAAELNQLGGAEAYHWTRLVRSEMINASQVAAIEAAKAEEGINLRWSTFVSKTTCKVCLERNGKVFDPAQMGLDGYFDSDETKKLERGEIKIGRYPHPQCRCSLIPTYQAVSWK